MNECSETHLALLKVMVEHHGDVLLDRAARDAIQAAIDEIRRLRAKENQDKPEAKNAELLEQLRMLAGVEK